MKTYITTLLILVSLSVQAQVDIKNAQQFLEKGEVTKSKAILTSGIKSYPYDLMAISLLGDIASFEKKWDVALTHYKKLLNHDPSSADYNFRYGGALGLKAINVSKLKAVVYIPEIKKHLEKAAEIDPKHIKSRRALVELYMQLPGLLGGSESKAQKYANELKKISPLEGALSQAFIFKQTGRESEARILVQKSLSQITRPHSTAEQNYLNYEFGKVTAEYNTDLQKGLKLLDAYIINYNYKDIHALEWAYYRKAQIHTLLKNKPEASKLINQALALKSDFEEAKLEKRKIQEL